jgi:predicted thioesterase
MKFIPKYRCPECGKEVKRTAHVERINGKDVPIKGYVQHLNACRLKAFRASVAAAIARAA